MYETKAPLAERMRPSKLEDLIGQEHLVGENGIIRKAIQTGNVPSMILWGPPGVGKTTIANIIANEVKRPFHMLSPDAQGLKGATACIVVPWFLERYEQGADWRSLAYWIHDHLPYSELQFFPKLCAFNINWHEKPKRSIGSFIEPKGKLRMDEASAEARRSSYAEFPPYRKVVEAIPG